MNLEHKTNHMFGEAISNKLERMPLERDVTTIGSHNLISNVACELNGMPLN